MKKSDFRIVFSRNFPLKVLSGEKLSVIKSTKAGQFSLFLTLSVLSLSISSCRSMPSVPINISPNIYSGNRYTEKHYEPPKSYAPLETNISTNSESQSKKVEPKEVETLPKASIPKVKERRFVPRVRKGFEFTMNLSRYAVRSGILEDLGNLGTGFGLQMNIHEQNAKNGIFIMWTFDHFFNTDGGRLDPRFRGEDYTNYILGAGYSRREFLTKYIQLNFNIGAAANFIEIDTFRSRPEVEDEEFTDVTFSAIAKLRLDFSLNLNTHRSRVHRVGPTLFYYLAPNPLGKFINGERRDRRTAGGSLAVGIDWVQEF